MTGKHDGVVLVQFREIRGRPAEVPVGATLGGRSKGEEGQNDEDDLEKQVVGPLDDLGTERRERRERKLLNINTCQMSLLSIIVCCT